MSADTSDNRGTGDGGERAGASFEQRRWNDPYWTSVWPKRERLTSSVTPYLLKHLDPQAGQKILDVGPGAGLASLEVAERVGASGLLVGADISEPLIALARRRAAEAGAGHVRFELADMQSGTVEGGPFDAASSQFGVMFFDEPVKAFANIRSHCRPGARLAFVCWQEMQRNPWFTGPAVAPFLPAPPAPVAGKSPTGPFAFADPAYVRDLLGNAGWSDVDRHPYEVVAPVEPDSILDEGQLRFQGVSAEQESQAWEASMAFLQPLRRDDGRYDAPLRFQVFTARS